MDRPFARGDIKLPLSARLRVTGNASPTGTESAHSPWGFFVGDWDRLAIATVVAQATLALENRTDRPALCEVPYFGASMNSQEVTVLENGVPAEKAINSLRLDFRECIIGSSFKSVGHPQPLPLS